MSCCWYEGLTHIQCRNHEPYPSHGLSLEAGLLIAGLPICLGLGSFCSRPRNQECGRFLVISERHTSRILMLRNSKP